MHAARPLACGRPDVASHRSDGEVVARPHQRALRTDAFARSKITRSSIRAALRGAGSLRPPDFVQWCLKACGATLRARSVHTTYALGVTSSLNDTDLGPPAAGGPGAIAPREAVRLSDATIAADSDETVAASDVPPLSERGMNRGAAAGTSLPMIGEQVGRFRVTRLLGRGGMGAVFLADDPELGRRVAIKLVAVSDAGSGTSATMRLQREAQSMAKVTHPNLVHVYDVGTVGDRVWIAMEYVPGLTLKSWLRAQASEQEEAPWQEILARFVDAGRGIAAAHRAGLIHRDFKPDNVICGDDGLVRVLDFGLARDVGAGAEQRTEAAYSLLPSTSSTPSTATPTAPTEITQTGALLGTPAYMSPEQHRGERTDVRTDIYSFCVALYEALDGKRPFDGRTYAELLGQVLSDAPVEPPRTRAPPRVVAAILRGLARDRAERWGSMEELLAALTADDTQASTRPRVSVGPLAAGVLVVGISAVLAYFATRTLPEVGTTPLSAANVAVDSSGLPRALAEEASARAQGEATVSAEVRKKLAAILVAPNARERLNRAEQYLEEVGDAGGAGRLALAEASAAGVLWEESCPRARMGLCITITEEDDVSQRDASRRHPADARPASSAAAKASGATAASAATVAKDGASQRRGACMEHAWPAIGVRDRDETATRARALAASAIKHALAGMPSDADAVEIEAWPTVISQAEAISADTELEAYLRLRPPVELRVNAGSKRKTAPLAMDVSAKLLSGYVAEKRAAFEALEPAYRQIIASYPGFPQVVALSRLGTARQHLVDEVARLSTPDFGDKALTAAYCDLLRDAVLPMSEAAVVDFRACSHEAMAARLSSEFVDLCDTQVNRIEEPKIGRVREVVRAHSGELAQCYAAGLDRDPRLHGTLRMKFSVAGNGTVEDVMIDASTPFPDEKVATCVAAELLRWTFPADPDGESTFVTYPFIFEPER